MAMGISTPERAPSIARTPSGGGLPPTTRRWCAARRYFRPMAGTAGLERSPTQPEDACDGVWLRPESIRPD